MRFGRIGLVAAAIVLALGTAFLVQNWLESERNAMRKTDNVPPPAPTARILVAKTDIGVGQFVTPDNVKWVSWPESGVQASYFVEGKRQISDAAGSVVRHAISAGEPLTQGQIVSPGDRGFMAAVLQPGMRAVSVPVTLTSGISGFVFPGDRVDIVLVHVYKPATDGDREHRAGETVLSDIRVLAVDQKTDNKPGEPILARSVTFEVNVKQAETLALAAEMGKLSLSLRSLANVDGISDDENKDTGVSSGDKGMMHTTYTLDSDASSLLSGGAGGKTGERVTLLRGGSATAAKASQ